jgi:hypothetical protein
VEKEKKYDLSVLVTTDGSGLFPLVVCLLFVAGAILIATMIARGGRRQRPGAQAPGTFPAGTQPPGVPVPPADPYAQVSTDELSDRANAALVAADNALKTSEQELGFAQAQYGAQATGPFAQALEASHADVAEAFRVRQRLDDDVPEDEPTRRAMLREVLDRCTVADRRLDAQAEARRLEGVAGELGTALGGLRDAAARARHAREQLDQAMLAARSTVDSAVEFITNRRGAVGAQARTRVAEAQRRLAEATAAAGADPVAALAAARSAQTLAEQATAAARDDVTRWSMPGSGGYGGSVVIGGGGLAGAVLGGILLDGMVGGAPRAGAGVRGFAGVNGGNGNTHPGRFGGPSTWTRDLSTTQ